MAGTVRVGVIGTSWWADMMHLPCLKSHAQAALVAICGRNRERAEELAGKYGIPQVFGDYREMIAKGGLEAVVVSSPDDLHYPMVMAALDAGLHVVCEKPLALTVAQAQEMCERAEKADVKHMIFFTNRWVPECQYLQQLVAGGYIGHVLHAQFLYWGGSNRHPGEYRWRFDGRRGNGILGDWGSHMIDLGHWLVGDIARVSAQISTFNSWSNAADPAYQPANDSALLNVEFAKGAQGVIHASGVVHVGEKGQLNRIVLCGEEGTLEADLALASTEIRGIRGDEKQPQVLLVPSSFWAGMGPDQPRIGRLLHVFATQPIADRLFIDAILHDQPITPSFRDGLQVQQVIEAATVSHQQGKWIPL